jgi:hypothetical protein
MESTGQPNKIQVSQKTADLLVAAGKESWLTAREELVSAKGKGRLQTYWLNSNRSGSISTYSETSSDLGDKQTSLGVGRNSPKIQRLIDWNVSIFQALLEEIIAHRHSNLEGLSKKKVIEPVTKEHKNVRDEVVEKLLMPDYSSTAIRSSRNFKIDPKATKQLRDYITRIASFYNADNCFITLNTPVMLSCQLSSYFKELPVQMSRRSNVKQNKIITTIHLVSVPILLRSLQLSSRL